ncbi:uncharacterized protein K460DRAFT_391226 [Cucurbitaria berberidis CBS 394.84]|uniref:Uncharacterized protein n=1 Tax=Cucurbitaria berberidis CBS 394.84 TaxID=1168544 RepID=A0A9P4GSP8_9PLEO|nr:uncharacterized protein K460DRAFT_391226 [Cucurbitaria berberidis CBS 394.84]KAF1850814.1 hypothetical protein K460DRAFT_391226 [Cucurbitaria berberidis CBS 394.84]
MEHMGYSPDSRTDIGIDRKRFAMMATIAFVSIAVLAFTLMVLFKYKRRPTQPAMPRAFLLPIYMQRYGSAADPTSTSTRSPLDDPSPAYEEEEPILARGNSIVVPIPAHTRPPRELSPSRRNANPPLFGSVHHRGIYRAPLQIHPALRGVDREARESVDTLPRYPNPPAYSLVVGPPESDINFIDIIRNQQPKLSRIRPAIMYELIIPIVFGGFVLMAILTWSFFFLKKRRSGQNLPGPTPPSSAFPVHARWFHRSQGSDIANVGEYLMTEPLYMHDSGESASTLPRYSVSALPPVYVWVEARNSRFIEEC